MGKDGEDAGEIEVKCFLLHTSREPHTWIILSVGLCGGCLKDLIAKGIKIIIFFKC